jgi:apolipoprotein N-acyltransferase
MSGRRSQAPLPPRVEVALVSDASGVKRRMSRRRSVAQIMPGCAETARGLTGWPRAMSAFVAGALSVLAMPPFFLSAALFITLPVLVWLIDGAAGAGTSSPIGAFVPSRWRFHPACRAAVIGWWFGFGYFVAGLFWVGEAFLVEAEKFAWALPLAVTAFPGGLALFYALATAAVALAWRPGFARVLVLALALSAAEWLRGHVLTGFPWNVLGYALTFPLPLMQSAGVFGIYGLTLWAVVVFAAPMVLLADRRSGSQSRSQRVMALLIPAAPLCLAWAYGAFKLAEPVPPAVDGIRLRLVQPSVPQREKWRPEKQREIFRDHLELSANGPPGATDGLAGVTHVVWPEAAMPFLPLKSPEALQAIGEMLPPGAYLLSGALRVADPMSLHGVRRRAYNSLMVFGPGGGLAAVYDKIHLVPFGEYLPFQETLERMGIEQLTRWRGGFSAGHNPRPLMHVPGLPPISTLICYEAIFPAAVVQGSERPGVLINVTNDGWFGTTTGPYQHFHQARVRAVEEGLPLVRVANNGISAVIDPDGRVLAEIGLNARGVIDSPLPAARTPPFYARFGDVVFVLCWLVLFSCLILIVRAPHSVSPERGLRKPL